MAERKLADQARDGMRRAARERESEMRARLQRAHDDAVYIEDQVMRCETIVTSFLVICHEYIQKAWEREACSVSFVAPNDPLSNYGMSRVVSHLRQLDGFSIDIEELLNRHGNEMRFNVRWRG